MSSRNFKNPARAARRGHIVLIPNGIYRGGTDYRTVKSDKVGAGTHQHNRWPKGIATLLATLGRQKWVKY